LQKFFFELRCVMKTRRWFREAAGIIFCGTFLISITGCVGYVDGPSGGVAVVAPAPPDVVVFGGDYDHGHDVHAWSHRGYDSRHDNDHDSDHGHRD
jgi:hypothetical protein